MICLPVIENCALVALRSTFGGYTLQQALEHRAEISSQVCRLMAPHMNKAGVKVEEAQVLHDFQSYRVQPRNSAALDRTIAK